MLHDVIYEIKGVKINYLCSDLAENVDTNVISNASSNSQESSHRSTPTVAQETVNDNSIFNTQSYYIFIYCICFSTIKGCNYWNYQTENAIVEHAIELFNKRPNETYLSTDLPENIRICDSTIQVTYTSRHEGALCLTSELSKAAFAELIFANTVNNTGFLIWLGNYALACIIESKMSVKKEHQRRKYFLVSPDETRELNLFKELTDSHSVVSRLCDILNLNEPHLDEVEYILQFLSIPSVLPKSERQRVLRKHKSNDQQNTVRENKRNDYKSKSTVEKQALLKRLELKYEQMDPISKQNLENLHLKYKEMDPIRKQNLLENLHLKYKEMDPIRKQNLLENLRLQYKEMDPITKQNLLENLHLQYIEMDPIRKQVLLENLHFKYNEMDPIHKQRLLENLHLKYKEMEPSEKIIFLEKQAMTYKAMDSSKKESYREKNRVNMKRKYHVINSPQKAKKNEKRIKKRKSSLHDVNLDRCISKFQSRIKEGPYICSVCNRLLYRKSVKLLEKKKYSSVPKTVFTDTASFDNKKYICTTCHSKVIKGKIPCQAVYNDMSVDEIPAELALLEKLEQILTAQRIVFEKIVVMPKGQQKKVSGAICNVPVDCDQTCKVLPRPPERSGIIMLKLKRKLEFRGHVYFQAVRPQLVENALYWLVQNNPLYNNVTTDMSNIDENLKNLQQNDTSTDSSTSHAKLPPNNDNEIEKNEQIEENEDPLNTHRQATNETCLQPVLPDYPVTLQQSGSLGNEIYDIAPGENRHPASIMTDKKCEQLAFPVLFPKGRFGYTDERKIKLSPVKYFNARLLHYSGRFATNSEYLFFAQFVLEQKKVADSINIALKKIQGQPITVSQIKSDVNKLKSMVCQDQAHLFLRQIPGTPPYWQKFMYEVVAMVKQLGIPTWFMTLSCADLRWPELFKIVARTQGSDITEDEIEALSYVERCQMLNANPVVTAKHFQHRVETFFSEVLLSQSNPIGKITYYALRIEFQMRGSPHLHALIWTADCPKLTSENKDAYIEFIDKHVQSNLPCEKDEPELHQLVKTYQKHNHSKTCRKYKNIPCRFNFGQFFTKQTIVAEPLDENINPEIKSNILDRRKEILTKVKQKIDEMLNPSKDNYDATVSEKDILDSVGVTEDQYYWALSISADSDFDLHLKRHVDSCFINNYFVAGIKGFAANVDLQPVFNHYKCITYVCSYFTKDETECSQAIANAAKEARSSNVNIRDGLKKIGAAFLSTREVSSQECVYRCMPELWLRKIFPKTVFVSTDLPEKRVRVTKTQNELDELDDDSTDIYKSNIIERYSLRPKGIPSVDQLCLAKFAAFYYKDYRTDDADTRDSQPDILNDELLESQHSNEDTKETCLPPKIKLMGRNEYMKCRKVNAVIRYHTPNL